MVGFSYGGSNPPMSYCGFAASIYPGFLAVCPMTASTSVHPARAEMDRWRHATPRPIMLSVRTECSHSQHGLVYRAKLGLNTYSGIRRGDLTDCENHLHAAMECLPSWGTWQLISPNIMLNEGSKINHGDFIFERLYEGIAQ